MKTEIPRYKASMPCQTQFVTNNDACGDNIFTQVKREGNVAIYKRTDMDGFNVPQFEVVVLKTVKAGTVFAKGAKPTENDYESYPGAKGWGKTGWTALSLERAEIKMKEVITGVVETIEIKEDTDAPKAQTVTVARVSKVKGNSTPVVIPEKEFTQADFAAVNGLPARGKVYNVLIGEIAKGTVKEARRAKVGPGRPTVFYTGV